MSLRSVRPSTLLAAAGLLAVYLTPLPSRAQKKDTLPDKLEDLNIRVQTDHYALAGTVTERTLQEYGKSLELIYHEYAAGFAEVMNARTSATDKPAPAQRGPAKSPPPAAGSDPNASTAIDPNDVGERFRVLIFATDEEYLKFGREYVGGGTEHSIGVFIPALNVLLISDRGNLDSTRSVLFHEAFHQFMARFVKNPPMWLNEGLAMYYGSAVPGRSGLKFVNPRGEMWRLVRKLIEKDRAIPLWDVVKADRKTFYDQTPEHVSGFDNLFRTDIYYAEAYTLIHTLLADATGRERLRNYVRDLAKAGGKNTMKVTQEYFGPETCQRMTSFWIDHVQKRPENQ